MSLTREPLKWRCSETTDPAGISSFISVTRNSLRSKGNCLRTGNSRPAGERNAQKHTHMDAHMHTHAQTRCTYTHAHTPLTRIRLFRLQPNSLRIDRELWDSIARFGPVVTSRMPRAISAQRTDSITETKWPEKFGCITLGPLSPTDVRAPSPEL